MRVGEWIPRPPDNLHHEEVVQLGREEVAPPHASRGMDTPKANEVHHEEVVQLNPKPEQQDALQVLVELLRGSCMRVGEWIPRQPAIFTTKRSYSLAAKG